MVRPISKKVKKHISIDELDYMIKHEDNERILERLIFIKYLYEGSSISKAIEKVKRTEPVAYTWLKNWNKTGYDGLKMKYGSGRPSKLTKKEQKEMKRLVIEKIKNKEHIETKKLLKIVKKKYGVVYSQKQMIELVNKWYRDTYPERFYK